MSVDTPCIRSEQVLLLNGTESRGIQVSRHYKEILTLVRQIKLQVKWAEFNLKYKVHYKNCTWVNQIGWRVKYLGTADHSFSSLKCSYLSCSSKTTVREKVWYSKTGLQKVTVWGIDLESSRSFTLQKPSKSRTRTKHLCRRSSQGFPNESWGRHSSALIFISQM